jgi:hypothetical protein
MQKQTTIRSKPTTSEVHACKVVQHYWRIARSLILLSLPLLLCSCASVSQTHAKSVAESMIQNPVPIGRTSTHTIDMNESGFYMLSQQAKGLRSTYWAAVKINPQIMYCPLLTELIIYLHHKNTCKLARIWEPDSVMRKRLIGKYGLQPELFDHERHLIYYWYLGATKTQSFILIGPEPFGKSDAADVTRSELQDFLRRVKEEKMFDVQLRYLGTAPSPRPPFWGEMHYFDLLDLRPHEANKGN